MDHTQSVTSFLFYYAQYEVANGGQKALLNVNYRENTYTIEPETQLSAVFRPELERIAKDLLRRKHNVNFADRVMKQEN